LTRSTSKPVLLRNNYRSRLEERIATQLEDAGVTFDYEGYKISYSVPARKARYTPDFPLGDPGNPTIIIEAKGRFRTAADRQKLALVKEQHPTLDLRLVFQNANLPIYKGSPTTYAMWADSHGFQWADKGKIPESWLSEIQK
jgi:hypothetical protein